MPDITIIFGMFFGIIKSLVYIISAHHPSFSLRHFMLTLRKYLLNTVTLFVISLMFNANATNISQTEAATGLKGILNQAAKSAVQELGTQGGFSNNPDVKIELPGSLGSTSKMLQRVGLGAQLSQLESSMNSAAEVVVPEAQQILLESIQQMTFSDAKSIVSGNDHAATAYLEKTNRTQLFNKLLPKVKTITNQSSLSSQYDTVLKKAATLGVTEDNLKIENYVTNKTLDGLFTVMGSQESYLRNNPAEAATSVTKKIFGRYIK